MKTKILCIVLLMTLISPSFLFSQSQNFGSITYNKAINVSGKQRMLSQKMSKAYLLIAKGIVNESIKKELNSSKFIFEKQLSILNQNATGSAVKLSIKNVQKIWTEFKPLIESAPSTATSLQIMNLNTRLLKACHDLVLSIEASSNYSNQFFKNKSQELTNTINVSGKQRMLSQRLCLYYTGLTMFTDKKIEFRRTLTSVFDEFDSVIGDLLISSYNNSEIEEELGLVMSVWEKFQLNKRSFLDGGFPLEEVYNTTNDLTKSFNKITGTYEVIAGK